MAATATSGTQVAIPKIHSSVFHKISKSSILNFASETNGESWTKLKSLSYVSSTWPLNQKFNPCPLKFHRTVTKAMSEASNPEPLPGLPIDLRGWKLCASLLLFFVVLATR